MNPFNNRAAEQMGDIEVIECESLEFAPDRFEYQRMIMNYTLYRIENPQTQNGLWYDRNANLTAVVCQLSNAKCASMEMPYNPELYAMGGLAWFSATDELEQMPNWVSLQDMQELAERGYNLYAIEVTEYRKVPGHAVFAEEHVVSRTQLDMSIFQ